MTERIISIGDRFELEYPRHSARINEAIHKWYEYALQQYIFSGRDLVLDNAHMFITVATKIPEKALIDGTPLALTTKLKRKQLIDSVGTSSVVDFVSEFGKWYAANLADDAVSDKRRRIEQTAHEHVLSWVGGLPDEAKRFEKIWDYVDGYLLSGSGKENPTVAEIGNTFIGCISAAIIEQFITDRFAPSDLFGPVV